jgi:hypothetical protein
MASLNHNFVVSEIDIFLRRELDSSGKTGGGISLRRHTGSLRQHSTSGGKVGFGAGSGLANRIRRSPLRAMNGSRECQFQQQKAASFSIQPG